jgi:acetyl esterase
MKRGPETQRQGDRSWASALSPWVAAPVELARNAAAERVKHARRQAGAKVIAGAFEGVSRAFRFLPNADPARHGVHVERDVPYLPTGRADHTLDVYRPIGMTSSEPLPVVFYVHGGAFRSLSKETHWIMGLAFARRGFVTVVPNYRLAPQHRFPAGLEDVAAAWRFMVENAARYGGDVNRIVLAGESAGANLALSLQCGFSYERDESFLQPALRTGVTPQAALLACGVFQVSDGDRFTNQEAQAQRSLHWFFRDRYQELELNYAPRSQGKALRHDLIDVVNLLERETPKRPLPPTFLPVGDKDHLKDDHARVARALVRHGTDAAVAEYPGEGHAFHSFVFRAQAQACWRDQFAFLAARGLAAPRNAAEFRIF